MWVNKKASIFIWYWKREAGFIHLHLQKLYLFLQITHISNHQFIIIIQWINFLIFDKNPIFLFFRDLLFGLVSPPPFLKSLNKQEPGALNEKSYFPHAPLSGARKEKASLFSMSQASVFRANELQRSQQSFMSGVSFPKQVSRPPRPPHWPALIWPLGSPGYRRCAHTGWKNKAGTLKKRVFWKGRLGWGVEETCWVTPAALIAAHSRWIIPCAYFNPTHPPPLPHRLLFWVKCDSPRCPRLIMRSGSALWWPHLLTYLLELGPDAEWGRHWKQYLSQRCYKISLLLFILITFWPQLSDDESSTVCRRKRTSGYFSLGVLLL